MDEKDTQRKTALTVRAASSGDDRIGGELLVVLHSVRRHNFDKRETTTRSTSLAKIPRGEPTTDIQTTL